MSVVTVTDRLELREFILDDAAAMVRLNEDPEVVRYTGDSPFAGVSEARELIEAIHVRYATVGYSRWAVVRRDTGEFIGWCGLSLQPASGETDLGFRFFRAAWGQGFATEAARASLALGFDRFHLQSIVGRAMEGNAASHHILRKLGFIPVHTFNSDDANWTQYELTAATWGNADGTSFAPQAGESLV